MRLAAAMTACICAAWAALAMSSPRVEQQRPEPSGSSNDGAGWKRKEVRVSSQDGSPPVEEIIVTARKRAERVQDIPLSIAVISAVDISARGVAGAEDYLRGFPGVNQSESIWGGTVVIRGIDTAPSFQQNLSSGTTVATYFGETPTTNSAGLVGGSNIDIKLVDIERVEILRGPQGTAFGSSSLGGAMRTIPVAPNAEQFEAKGSATYSSTAGYGGDNHVFEVVANAPVVEDKAAVRAVAYKYFDSGFYRNVAGSDSAFQALSAVYGAQAFAADEQRVGDAEVTGGRMAALVQATDDLRFTLSYLAQRSELDGQAHAGTDSLTTASMATLGRYDQALWQVAPEQILRGQRGGLFDTDIDILNGTAEYDAGWGTVLATFSHLESNSVAALGYFGIPVADLGRSRHREQSGEVRITTNIGTSWTLLGGIYAEGLKDRGYFSYYWPGTPASNPFRTSTSFVSDYLDRRNLRQKAAFAEVSWEFLPRFTLTGGMRAYDYERTARVTTTGALFSDTDTVMAADASGTTFRANLSHKPSEDTLLYASWSQGFRLGKPQPGLPADLCDINTDGIIDGTTAATIESTKSLNSDTVDSYEIGAKVIALDRRLTLSGDVFYIEWSELPFGVTAPPFEEGGCHLTYNANAGAALSKGVEFQANLRLKQGISVDIGGGWIDPKLTEDVPSLDAVAGDRLPGSPKATANVGLQNDFKLAGRDAFIRGDLIYVSEFYSTLQRNHQTRAGEYLKADLSAQVSLAPFNVGLFIRNLTNADDFTFRSALGNAGERYGSRLRPRTVGVKVDYTF